MNCHKSTIIPQITASFPKGVYQKSVINEDLSNHHVSFCLRKFSKFETVDIEKHLKFRSFTNYRVDDYKKCLGQLVFPRYSIFDVVNEAHFKNGDTYCQNRFL